MTKRLSAMSGYLIGLCLGAILLSACSEKDDTEAIRQLIVKGVALAEKKQLGDLMDLTTPEFVALPGNHDAQTAKGILFGAFLHYGKFKIHFPKPAVEMASDGNSADATVHFLIVRQNQSIPGIKELYDDPRQWIETVGEKADLYQLKLAMVKDGGDWLVGKAELEGFKGTSF